MDGDMYDPPAVTIRNASTISSRLAFLEKLVDGKSYQTIAGELFVSVETVRSHVKKMYKVLHVNNKTEAIAQYMKGYIK